MYLTLAFLFGVLLPVSAIARGIILKADPYKVVTAGIIYSAAGQLIVIAVAGLMGQSVGEQLQTGIEALSKTLAANSEIMQSLGMDELSEAERVSSLQKIYGNITQMLPASFVIWGAIISYLEYIILYRWLHKKDSGLRRMTPVREFSMKRQAFLCWFGTYFLSYLISLSGFSAGQTVYVNIDYLFRMAFAYQGISFIFYFVYMKKWPKAVAVIAVILLMTQSLGVMGLYLLGFFDLVFGLKGRVRGR